MLVLTLLTCGVGRAQGPFGAPAGVVMDAKTAAAMAAAQAARSGKPGKPPSGKPGEKTPGKEDEKKPGSEGAEPPEPKVIRRDANQSDEADSKELSATVGEDGRVAFSFRNQPWGDLVKWLSDISDMPLDWQELPGDRVNIVSPGRYTVVETRDLFNRHLLSRGYTLLELDGGLVVAKTAGINPAMVPRVSEAELSDLPNYTFVRTLVDVGWLSAEKLSEELKPMVSTNGRLTALTSTNRIEAMDAAVNLRQIVSLMRQEGDSGSRDALAPEFKLRYVSAEDAKTMLEQFLGVEKKSAAPMSPQQMQMMQQMAQRSGNKAAPPKPTGGDISIVANVRQNSVIIRAPADRIAIAREFINRIDVASANAFSLEDLKTRVEPIRLVSLNPEKLIEIIQDMNVLEPMTRMRADKENRAVVVSGSAADRYIIQSLVERLDGSGRSFEVLQLRRLDPAEVAESIAFLMGQQEEKKDTSRSSRYSYFGYGYGGGQEEEAETDEFRVSANARYRQVLLWANESEMAEVRSLLIKLGEIPPPGGSSRPYRVIEASSSPETLEYLKRLQKQWNAISQNPLELPDASEFTEPELPGESSADAGKESKSETTDEDSDKAEKTGDSDDTESTEKSLEDLAARDDSYAYMLTQLPGQDAASSTEPVTQDIRNAKDFDQAFGTGRSASSETATESPGKSDATRRGKPAPIRITLDAKGNLVLSSEDTKALDKIENMMLQVAPPQRPYHVFYVEHQTASWIHLNLTDYYKDLEEDEDSDADNFFRYYWGSGDNEEDDSPAGLGQSSKLQFVWDNDTKSIVVRGASADQLKTIADLIKLWDKPTPVDDKRIRYTKLVPVKYGDAESIANTIKDAYRDLLSSNDKAFKSGGNKQGGEGSDKKQGEKERGGGGGGGSGFENAESGQSGGGSDFSFTGKLSIGVDDVGNTLIVSAEGESLLDLVEGMVKQLDEAAQPSDTVGILKFSGSLGDKAVSDALRILGAEGAPQASASTQNSNPAGRQGDRRRE